MRRRSKVTPLVGWTVAATGLCAAVAAAVYARTSVAPTIPPQDGSLEQELSQLTAATPEAARLERRLGAATAALPSATDFDSWLKGWSSGWTQESQSAESAEGIERRRYVIAHNDRELQAWPDILAGVKSLCAEPGVTVDGVELVLTPDSTRFAVAQVTFSVRLRR